jgi:hypothetical protein
MNWDDMTKEQKQDFIADYTDKHNTTLSLYDEVMGLIFYNDMINNWWMTGDNDAQEQIWSSLTSSEKISKVEDEVLSWDKTILIEFLIDNMNSQQIETFKNIYNEINK